MSDLTLLRDTLDVYGTDVSRWPDGRRDALASVLDAPEGREAFAEAAALDQLVGMLEMSGNGTQADAPPARADEDMLEAIMSRTVGARADGAASWKDSRPSAAVQYGAGRRPLRAALISGALAASLVIGFFSGYSGTGAVLTERGVALASIEDFSGDDDEFDWAELAPGGFDALEDDLL